MGLGAAVTVGQGTAAAAPDDAAHAGTHVSQGANGADGKRAHAGTASPRRDTFEPPSADSISGTRDRGSRTTRGSASIPVKTPNSVPSTPNPRFRVNLDSPTAPSPNALLSASARPNAVADTGAPAAAKTAPDLFENTVIGVLSSIGFRPLPTGFPLPATPLGPLFAALSGAVREVELSLHRRPVVTKPIAATALGIGELPSLAVDSVDQSIATANSAKDEAAATEAEMEQSQAEFDMSTGWIPGVGTVINAGHLVSDFLAFTVAALKGDLADMGDEIGDMTVDVVGMIPILGGPLAAMLHHVFDRIPTPTTTRPLR